MLEMNFFFILSMAFGSLVVLPGHWLV